MSVSLLLFTSSSIAPQNSCWAWRPSHRAKQLRQLPAILFPHPISALWEGRLFFNSGSSHLIHGYIVNPLDTAKTTLSQFSCRVQTSASNSLQVFKTKHAVLQWHRRSHGCAQGNSDAASDSLDLDLRLEVKGLLYILTIESYWIKFYIKYWIYLKSTSFLESYSWLGTLPRCCRSVVTRRVTRPWRNVGNAGTLCASPTSDFLHSSPRIHTRC